MYRLIHIEPDSAMHRAVVEALTGGAYPFAVEPAAINGKGPPVAAPESVEAVVLGGNAGGSLLDDLRRCRGWFPGRPIIVLTETPGMSFAQEVLRAGAQDVVLKQERSLAVLARIVLYAIERAAAERRQQRLQHAAKGLSALLDTIVANPVDCILQTDAGGVIERASPSALALLGLAGGLPAGLQLEERVRHDDRARLNAFFELTATAARPLPMSFPFVVDGETRLVELAPMPLGIELAEAPRLFRLGELVATAASRDDAAEPPPAGEPRPAPPAAAPPAAAPPAAAPPAAAVSPPAAARPSVPPASPGACAPPAGRLADRLEQLGKRVIWRCCLTQGVPGGRCGFLAADPGSAPALAGFAARAGDDADLALALDRLQLGAWQTLVASDLAGSPHRLVVELSYATVTSRAHLERFEAALGALGEAFGARCFVLLRHVPAGIHVPTLVKVTRTLAGVHRRPGLELTEPEADHRLLPFDHLAMLAIGFADLKRAVAADAKTAAAFLRRARNEGALVTIRGAAGPLAEKLRQRLPVDLTVEA